MTYWTQNQTVNFINSYQQKIVDLRNIVIKYMEKNIVFAEIQTQDLTLQYFINSIHFLSYMAKQQKNWLADK